MAGRLTVIVDGRSQFLFNWSFHVAWDAPQHGDKFLEKERQAKPASFLMN